ncbi:MAG: CDP-alcohol phosphatidyltransferase family protein [Actinomycetota bacterium]
MSEQLDPAAPKGTPANPSDAILTVPNIVTFARLALIPVFLWLALGPENIAAAFVVGFVCGSTDWIDGKIARRYNQVSKLGIALDPLFDRITVAAAATVIIMLDLAPLWTVIVVLARDGLLLAMIPFLARKGVPRPAVTWNGKAGSFGTMFSFGFFIGAAITDQPMTWLRVVAWLCYVPGVTLSYLAAGEYARSALASLRGSGAQQAQR